MDVHVEQSDLVAGRGQRDGDVHRHGALAHPALAAHDEELVAYL